MDNKVYLQEAFKALDMLNEEDFNLDTLSGQEDFTEFQIEDEQKPDFIDIMDVEAVEEEDIKDSYIGKLILDCCVCHNKFYKDREEIDFDEDSEVVNAEEECPYCYSTDGFKIIGMVAPFEKTEEEPEEEPEEEIEVADEEETEVDESLDDGVCPNCGKTPCECDIDEACNKNEACGYKRFQKNTKKDLTESADISEYQKWVDYDMKKYGKISKLTMSKIKHAGFSVVKDQYGDYEVIADRKDESIKEDLASYIQKIHDTDEYLWNLHDTDYSWLYDECAKYSDTWGSEDSEDSIADCIRKMPKEKQYEILDKLVAPYNESLTEDFERVEIETDKEKMEMTSDDDGRVTVTTEPKSEVVAPVSDDVQSELNPVEEEEPKDEAEPEEDIDFEEEDVDIDSDIDDFSEDEFDELGESYLKKIYENVNSYKTISVNNRNNKLIVEGIIKFNSGNQKKTSFIFEAASVKGKTVKFIGENAQITRGRKAFTITGNVNNGKFITESFNYNYRTKDSKGNPTRIYGTLKNESLNEADELSKKSNSLSNLLIKNKNKIDNATSKEELISVLQSILKDNGGQKAKSVIEIAKSKRNFEQALQYVYNFILKGDNLGSIDKRTVANRRDVKA